jgi:Spy/CpxP family protein refolding chaperone
MNIKKLSLVAALTAGMVLAGATLASAQDAKEGKKGERKGGGSIEQRMERMTSELKLTDEQKPKVKVVLEDLDKKRAEYRDLEQDARREKMRAAMEEQDKKLKAILTSEQYTKWQEMRQSMKGKGGGKKAEKKN